MAKGRTWLPCRVCGRPHQNPRSSSLCPEHGREASEKNNRERREAEQEFSESPFGLFMSMTDEERWKWVFDKFNGDAS